jgi:glycosyltransferase involved in cell wall biosynthesis
MDQDISLSICVPALNEEKSICRSVEDLRSGLAGRGELEIIIVDDGSKDATFKLAQELTAKFPEVKTIRHEYNQGIGSCYRDALALARGKYFTWFPADGEDLPQEIRQCLPHLNEESIVVSHHLDSDKRTKMRRMISRFYTFVLNKHFNLKLKYFNGLSIIPTASARKMHLISDGFFCNAEIVIRAIRSGHKVVELSTPLSVRTGGKSKALSFGSLCRAARDLVHIIRSR